MQIWSEPFHIRLFFNNFAYMKRFLLAFCLFCISLSGWAQYRTVTDIPYSKADAYASERCKLDVYYPSDKKDCPVVVWFHGGGLTGGSKFIPAELRESGLDKHWLARYGVDADRIKALVPYSGQVITHFNVRSARGMQATQPLIDQYAPLFHVRAEAPPIVIISGDLEMELYGRYEETAYFWRMLKLVGHPDVSIYELDGYDHGAMAEPAHHILKAQIKRLCL